MHGKFYNKQFLIDNEIRFNPELYSHEDVCFNQQISILWREDNSTIYHSTIEAYKWNFKENPTRKELLDYLTVWVKQFFKH